MGMTGQNHWGMRRHGMTRAAPVRRKKRAPAMRVSVVRWWGNGIRATSTDRAPTAAKIGNRSRMLP